MPTFDEFRTAIAFLLTLSELEYFGLAELVQAYSLDGGELNTFTFDMLVAEVYIMAASQAIMTNSGS